MIARIKERLPLALSILAVALITVPALAHGVEHAKFAHKAGVAKKAKKAKQAKNAGKLDGIDSTGFYKTGTKVADSNNLDGIDAAGFYGTGSTVDNSQMLDGFDSSVFRTKIDHNREPASDCDMSFDDLCAPIEIVVPPGQSYRVSIWSSGSWTGPAGVETLVRYCSARAGGPLAESPSCVTPFAFRDLITIPAGESRSAASLGETTFSGGTWQVGTIVRVDPLEVPVTTHNQVITKVLVRDAAAEAPGSCPGGATLC